jgi:hypothetical protein
MAGILSISIEERGLDLAAVGPSVIREMKLEAPALAFELANMVRAKTPVLTGALQSDIHGIPNTGSNELAYIYPTGVAQLGTWHREYAKYQEGPPMGTTTYTNPPRQMFQSTADGDGLAFTQAWADQAVVTGIAMAGTLGGGGMLISV